MLLCSRLRGWLNVFCWPYSPAHFVVLSRPSPSSYGRLTVHLASLKKETFHVQLVSDDCSLLPPSPNLTMSASLVSLEVLWTTSDCSVCLFFFLATNLIWAYRVLFFVAAPCRHLLLWTRIRPTGKRLLWRSNEAGCRCCNCSYCCGWFNSDWKYSADRPSWCQAFGGKKSSWIVASFLRHSGC